MSKKIVAIGGGENGRLGPSGTRYPYELANQDKEIIRLTGKEHPNFLLIAHSQPLEKQEGYFQEGHQYPYLFLQKQEQR